MIKIIKAIPDIFSERTTSVFEVRRKQQKVQDMHVHLNISNIFDQVYVQWFRCFAVDSKRGTHIRKQR